MPITVECAECEQSLTLHDDVAFGSFRCPACGAKVYLGDPDEVDRLERMKEEEEEERKRRKKKKRLAKNRARIEGLGKVNLALAFHFAGVLVFLAALWAYWLAFGIMAASMVTGGMPDEQAIEFLHAVTLFAVGLSGIATLLEVPCTVLSFFVPDGPSRGWLTGVLACRLGMIGCIFWFAFDQSNRAPLTLNIVLFLAAFFLWMWFLRRFALYLAQQEMAKEVIRLMVQAICSLIAVLIFLFCLSLLVRLMMIVESPMARMFIISGFAAPIASFIAAWYKISGESILRVVMYPTGVTFLLKYLEMIGSLRMVIMRRA